MSALTSLVVDDLFKRRSHITNQQNEQECEQNVVVRVSFVEIYRETIRDLNDGGAENNLTVNVCTRATPSEKPAVFLDGAKERTVESAEQLQAVISDGLLLRHTAAKGMNASSSRSHSIITIYIFQSLSDMDDGTPRCLSSKIHLVDLAGSERSKRTHAQGARFAEGVDINKGLFSLAKVISTLADNVQRAPAPATHVPYRDSKLTRLLQDSLGGSARTLLVACVSPASSSAEETLGTLRYAQRAKHIRNKPTVNTEESALEVSDLRAALARARAKMGGLLAENERLRRRSTRTSQSESEQKEEQENEKDKENECAICARRRPHQQWATDIDVAESDKVEFMTSTPLPSTLKRINTAATRAALSSDATGVATPYSRRVAPIDVAGTLKHSHTSRRAVVGRAQHQHQEIGSKPMTSEACTTTGRGRARSPVNVTGTRGRRRRSKSTTPSSSLSSRRDFTTDTYTLKRHKHTSAICTKHVDPDEGAEVALERALGESRVEEVRCALKERLRQAETDKCEIEAARGALVQRLKRAGADTDMLRSKVRSVEKENRRLRAEVNRLSTARERADASAARMRINMESVRGEQRKAARNAAYSTVASMRAGSANLRRANSAHSLRYHGNGHATKQPLRNHSKMLRGRGGWVAT